MDSKSSYSPEERLRILKMVEDGKVSAAEGASLLDALNQGRKVNRGVARPITDAEPGSPRWLRVRVTDLESGRSKATVNIPFGLMDWGLRIGAHFAPEMEGYDLQELGRILREEGPEGKIVDVIDDEDGEHVEIFVE
jgi:hypothetical protein